MSAALQLAGVVLIVSPKEFPFLFSNKITSIKIQVIEPKWSSKLKKSGTKIIYSVVKQQSNGFCFVLFCFVLFWNSIVGSLSRPQMISFQELSSATFPKIRKSPTSLLHFSDSFEERLLMDQRKWQEPGKKESFLRLSIAPLLPELLEKNPPALWKSVFTSLTKISFPRNLLWLPLIWLILLLTLSFKWRQLGAFHLSLSVPCFWPFAKWLLHFS